MALIALSRELVLNDESGNDRRLFEAVNAWLRVKGLSEAKLENDNTRPNSTFRRALAAYRTELGAP